MLKSFQKHARLTKYCLLGICNTVHVTLLAKTVISEKVNSMVWIFNLVDDGIRGGFSFPSIVGYEQLSQLVEHFTQERVVYSDFGQCSLL